MSVHVNKGVSSLFYSYLFLKNIYCIYTNSVDTDQMLGFDISDMGLNKLLGSFL